MERKSFTMEFLPTNRFGFCRSYQPPAHKPLETVMANSIAPINFYHGMQNTAIHPEQLGSYHRCASRVESHPRQHVACVDKASIWNRRSRCETTKEHQTSTNRRYNYAATSCVHPTPMTL